MMLEDENWNDKTTFEKLNISFQQILSIIYFNFHKHSTCHDKPDAAVSLDWNSKSAY